MFFFFGGGQIFRKSKLQTISDNHKIGIFQFPMVKMAMKAKHQYTRLLKNIVWLLQLLIKKRKIKPTSYGCVFYVFYDLSWQEDRTPTQYASVKQKAWLKRNLGAIIRNGYCARHQARASHPSTHLFLTATVGSVATLTLQMSEHTGR